MYGLRKDIDLQFLKGRELEQIAIGLYQVIFSFDENVAISVEGQFKFFDGSREWIWKQEPNCTEAAAKTVALLGQNIERFEAHEDGTLILSFGSNKRLTILDSSKEYQSYDITRPGQTIVV